LLDGGDRRDSRNLSEKEIRDVEEHRGASSEEQRRSGMLRALVGTAVAVPWATAAVLALSQIREEEWAGLGVHGGGWALEEVSP